MSDNDAGNERADASASAVDAGPEVTPELCDGSSTVRLRYAVTGGGQSPLGDEPMLRNGWSYWVITGSCHYYVMVDPWKEVREGHLSRKRAQRIASGVHYGRLSELAGGYGPVPPDHCSDCGGVSLGDATHAIGCYGPCETAPAPAREALDFAVSTLTDLDDDGAPVHGPIRISLVRYDSAGPMTMSTAQMAVAWPLTSAQPAAIAWDPTDPSGDFGTLIEVESDAQALRDLRDALWAGEFGPPNQFQWFFWIWGDTMLTRYELRFRDTIPLEDENGEIQMEFGDTADIDAGT